MKRFFCIITLLAALMITSCSGSSSPDSSDGGYAPSSIPSGQFISGVSTFVDIGSSTMKLTTAATGMGYSFDGTPSAGYVKTGPNSATLQWSFTLVSDGRWSSGSSGTKSESGKVTLFFISPSEGYASGTVGSNTVSDKHFTLL